MGATENIKEGNEDIREVTFLSCVLNSLVSLNFQFCPSVALNSTCKLTQSTGAVCAGVSGHDFGKIVQVSGGSE